METFWSFLRTYSTITTGLTLVGFTLTVGVVFLRGRHRERLAAIKRAQGDTAIQLVNGTLIALRVPIKDLTKKQRFDLAKSELDRLSRRDLRAAILVGLVSAILAVLVGVAVIGDRVAREFGKKEFEEALAEIRRGTPAGRQAMLTKLMAGPQEQRERVADQIAAGILSSQGRELCNFLLAAKALDGFSGPNKLLERVSAEAEYQLINPVCSSESRPDFSNTRLEDVAMVRPNLSDAQFSGGELIQVSFRDNPDYSGRGDTACRLSSTLFIGTTIESSSFSGCTLSNVSFNSATLRQVNFHRSVLRRVDFGHANTVDLRFLGGTLEHVDFRGLNRPEGFRFALGVTGRHVRLDFELASKLGSLPDGFATATCISSSEANGCWDLASPDNPECRQLDRPQTYVVADEADLENCRNIWEKT